MKSGQITPELGTKFNHFEENRSLAASLCKHLVSHWSLYHESWLRVSQAGLILELSPTAILQQAGRQVSESGAVNGSVEAQMS